MARKKTVVVDPEKIEWEPIERVLERVGAPAPEALKGVWVKVLNLDEKKRAATVLLKYGQRIP